MCWFLGEDDERASERASNASTGNEHCKVQHRKATTQVEVEVESGFQFTFVALRMEKAE